MVLCKVGAEEKERFDLSLDAEPFEFLLENVSVGRAEADEVDVDEHSLDTPNVLGVVPHHCKSVDVARLEEHTLAALVAVVPSAALTALAVLDALDALVVLDALAALAALVLVAELAAELDTSISKQKFKRSRGKCFENASSNQDVDLWKSFEK